MCLIYLGSLDITEGFQYNHSSVTLIWNFTCSSGQLVKNNFFTLSSWQLFSQLSCCTSVNDWTKDSFLDFKKPFSFGKELWNTVSVTEGVFKSSSAFLINLSQTVVLFYSIYIAGQIVKCYSSSLSNLLSSPHKYFAIVQC